MDQKNLLADRTSNMGENAIREILKVVSKEGMISLAGGIPSESSFPLDIVKKITEKVLNNYGAQALQYGLTEGFEPLREVLKEYTEMWGIKASHDEIIITSGSQGALDSIAKVMISKGDHVAVEAPTYLGAISAFNPYEPSYLTMETDEKGVVPESLEKILKKNSVKLIYLVPTFQNPTGRTLSIERREKIAYLIKKYNALLVEDDPYSALRYDGESLPSIKSLAPQHTIYIGTLSKVLSPGLRVGFALAPSSIRNWMVVAKQGIDLHTGSLSQMIGYEYLKGGYFKEHLPYICNLYKPKKDAMLKALKDQFPDSYSWSKPEGGMFVWVEGPKGLNTEALYHKAVENNVAFVPGRFFYTDNSGNNTMRLNFTMGTEDDIAIAVKKLGSILPD